MLNKGKPSREHTYPAIRAALLSLLSAWGSPFTLADVAQGCRIQATACDITGALPKVPQPSGGVVGGLASLAGCKVVSPVPPRSTSPPPHPTSLPCSLPSPRLPAWLHLPEADRALAAFNARAAGNEPGGRPLAKELFFQEDIQGEVGAGCI